MSCTYLSDGTLACCYDREATPRTQGVWTSCDECGHDWWCVVGERDYLDEPVTWVCSDGCGWDYDDEDGEPW